MNFFLTKKQRIQNLFKKQKDFFVGEGRWEGYGSVIGSGMSTKISHVFTRKHLELT